MAGMGSLSNSSGPPGCRPNGVRSIHLSDAERTGNPSGELAGTVRAMPGGETLPAWFLLLAASRLRSRMWPAS
jgi:hypothetical protein